MKRKDAWYTRQIHGVSDPAAWAACAEDDARQNKCEFTRNGIAATRWRHVCEKEAPSLERRQPRMQNLHRPNALVIWPYHIHKCYEFYEDGASCETVAQLNITVSSVARFPMRQICPSLSGSLVISHVALVFVFYYCSFSSSGKEDTQSKELNR